MAAEQTMQARLAIHGERVVYPMLMHVEGTRHLHHVIGLLMLLLHALTHTNQYPLPKQFIDVPLIIISTHSPNIPSQHSYHA